MFTRNRERIRQIKEETRGHKALVETAQIIIKEERQKDLTPEEMEKLQQIDISLSYHLSLIEENEKLIAKLERPIWKLF